MKGYKFFFVIVLIAFSIIVRGQHENRIWYFGPTNLGLQFAPVTNTLSVLTNKYTPYSGEGCTVIQEPQSGQLMFYTNGIVAVDANHQLMPNGSGLIGHASSAQNGLVCPNPANCNQYYIFHNSANGASGSLYYSIVDMTLPGNGTALNPRGDIVTGSKNILLSSQVSEAHALIPAATGEEYWMISAMFGTSTLKIHKITSTGVSFITNYSTGYVMQDQRCLRYSKVNGKLALLSTYEADVSLLMDFDASTGQVSNPVVIAGTPMGSGGFHHGMYDCEWSADGTKLYISKYRVSSPSSGGKLYQYDLNIPNSPPVLIFSVGNSISYMARGLKRGPDDKIYFLYNNTTFNDTRYVGVVNNPNLAGTACNFNPTGLNFGIDQGNVHKFSDHLTFGNLSPVAAVDHDTLVVNTCSSNIDTLQITPLVNDLDPQGDTLYLSSVVSVAHGSAVILPGNVIEYVNSPGFTGVDTIQYAVCDTRCVAGCDTAMILVAVDTSSFSYLSLGSDVTLCPGQSVMLSSPASSSYAWSTGDTVQDITVSSAGTYWLEINNGTCVMRDTIVVQAAASPQATITGPTTICSGQTVNLTSNAVNGGTYQWTGGITATTQNVTVTPASTTTYYLTVDDGTCSSAPDTHIVNVLPLPVPAINGVTSICSGQSTTLTASGGVSYQWSGGSSATTSSITVSPAATTIYYVTVSDGTCMSQPLAATVQVTPVPVVSVSGNTAICTGQSTTLTAAGGNSYQWSTGDTTQSVTVSPNVTTTYNVTVANGSCYSAPYTVTVNVTPFQGANITGPPSVCSGSNATLNATGGGTYQWSTGASTSSITVNPPVTTTYSVVVTNSSGCTDTAFYTLNVNPPPFVNAGPDVTICAGDSIQLSGTFSGSTYYWTPNSNISSIYPLDPWVYPTTTTVYVMVGMSQNDCGGSDSVTVTVSPCTGIGEYVDNEGILIVPNPANDYFEVVLDKPVDKAVIYVYNALGQVVRVEENVLAMRTRIDVSGLAKGLYFVKVSAENGDKLGRIVIE